MRIIALSGLACLLCLGGCRKAENYRFSDEQLAWQPYKTGDIMRFGCANNGRTRTYRVTNVSDRMESPYCGGGINLWGTVCNNLQYITVSAERSDTVSHYYITSPFGSSDTNSYALLELRLDDDHSTSDSPVIEADVSWANSQIGPIQLQSTIAGTPFLSSGATPDTTSHLRTNLTLGGTTYDLVLQTNRLAAVYNDTIYQPVNQLFYAKYHGVVAFREGRTLWYRLP